MQAGPLVAADQEPEEEAGLLAGQREVAELVQDEHPGIDQLMEGALQPILMPGADQPAHQRFQRQEAARSSRPRPP